MALPATLTLDVACLAFDSAAWTADADAPLARAAAAGERVLNAAPWRVAAQRELRVPLDGCHLGGMRQ